VELVHVSGTGWFRCTVCGRSLGDQRDDFKRHALVRELELRELGDANALCSERYVLREYSCPGCGTAIAADVQERSEEPLPDLRLLAPGVTGGTGGRERGTAAPVRAR
jgi:acetone carboxylase gamma subunit